MKQFLTCQRKGHCCNISLSFIFADMESSDLFAGNSLYYTPLQIVLNQLNVSIRSVARIIRLSILMSNRLAELISLNISYFHSTKSQCTQKCHNNSKKLQSLNALKEWLSGC